MDGPNVNLKLVQELVADRNCSDAELSESSSLVFAHCM